MPMLVSLAAAGLLFAPAAIPRIRIVPQTSDGLMQDIEESRDGSRLVTHDKGYAPRLWDAKRQILLTVLTGHPDPVLQVGFSPDGRRVLTRSGRELRIWDSARAKLVYTFPAPAGDELSAAAFSPDGTHLGVGTAKGAVLSVDAVDPAKFTKLGAHTKAVNCISFAPDSMKMVSGADDATGRLWDVAANAPLWQVAGHKGAVRWATFSPKGDYVLTTGFDNKACLWNAQGKLLQTYDHVIGDRSVANVQMSAQFVGKGGTEIAACDAEGTINLYRLGEAKPARQMKGHERAVREMRKSHDGAFLATYSDDQTLRMWDVAKGAEIEFDAEDGLPTAGEFSPTRDVFWLGYNEGTVRQFNPRTGKATKETLGSVTTLGVARLMGTPEANLLWLRSEHSAGLFGGGQESQHLFLDPRGMNKPIGLNMTWDMDWFSPDGRFLAITNRRGGLGFGTAILDLVKDSILLKVDPMFWTSWSLDSTRAAVWDNDDNNIAIFNAIDRKVEHSWEWPIEKKEGGILAMAWHPNGKWVASGPHVNGEVFIWDTETGKLVRNLGKFGDDTRSLLFTPDGSKLLGFGYGLVKAYDTVSGKSLWERKLNLSMWPSYFPNISADGMRIAVANEDGTYLLDTGDGRTLLKTERTTEDAAAISPDGRTFVTLAGNEAIVWDVDAKKELRRLDHADEVRTVQFFNDRLITMDKVGGLNVWSKDGKKLASMVLMRDGSWLVYDDQGRYDAPEPNNVTGAYFVLEWDGGLEPISMPQLKSQFYEPNLLAKVLGLDKEALRDVPNLESLRLAPDLTVKPTGEMAYSISATERDNGGIGAVSVLVNGKEVLRKKSARLVKLDLNDYSAYLLPEALLTDGRRNLLTVSVTNEAGDLASLPETLDVGAPKALKVPDVRLYALCVGTGDYVGTGGDLKAPPSDAKALASALKATGERLLPGRVEVTTLTTEDADNRPTRTRIMEWLAETSKKATSADVVFVFLAGHGMSRIGDKGGYYYLTSEADPGDITPATAATSTISGEDLRVALAAIPAGKQVVVLDTCHSGAASDSLFASRSVSGEYQRAWESIRDTSGTWLLAGAASDQLSYESPNVDHGMLTYSLLEAIDKASPEGLRQTPSGELFVDVERWLNYAANRVESLKQEVGIKGIQRPEFKRAAQGGTFDIGVVDGKSKGFLDLKPPMPIVIVGGFEQDEEDPLNLEDAVAGAMRESRTLKPWFDVAKHPNVYRMTGTYTVQGETVKVKLILQQFDERQQRKNLESVEITGENGKLPELAAALRKEIETRISARVSPKAGG